MKFHPSLAHRSLSGRAAGQRLILRHDRRVLRRTAWLDAIGPKARHESYWPLWRQRLYHAAELRWTTRNLARTLAAIRARAHPAVGHLSGWLCIHHGEGAWNSQTGNGYYGGLQMTYGWMGLVANAALLSPSQQMAAAETGYRRSGYSHAWLSGQWPNTYPPCAGYF
jgi:hypothetical protein